MACTENQVQDRKGLSCPACGGEKLRVLYTRPAADGRLRRRRICRDCGRRLTTHEIVAR